MIKKENCTGVVPREKPTLMGIHYTQTQLSLNILLHLSFAKSQNLMYKWLTCHFRDHTLWKALLRSAVPKNIL